MTNVPLPLVVWRILAAFGLLALVSPNPGVGLFGVVIAAGVSKLLWRPAEPQALLFIVGFQWLQGFAPVLLALFEGETIARVFGGREFEMATILTLLGIGVFALGLKAATSRAAPIQQRSIVEGLQYLNRQRLVRTWLVLTVASSGLAVVGASLPAIRQALISVEIWKWAAVLLLFFRWLSSGQGGRAAFCVIAIEITIGMMGYFSAFKEVLFILMLAGTGAFAIGRERSKILVGLAVLSMVFLGFWQAIKVSYRDFLSQGEHAQVVLVSIPERVNWLAGSIFEVDRGAMVAGWEEGLRRLCYVTYFGHSLRAVPSVIPHTDGQLWKEAVLHPLTPRLLFPNKPSINDSERTNAYTGVRVAGADQGTSISIGYMGESYIDFGRWGMFVPIFLWGWLVGWCFEFLRRKAPHPLLGTSLASCLLLSSVMLLETSNIKMTGSLISGFLVTAVLMRFYGKYTWRWLTTAQQPSRRGRSVRAFGTTK